MNIRIRNLDRGMTLGVADDWQWRTLFSYVTAVASQNQ